MAPRGSQYDTDWIFSRNSNIHVAVHPDWYTRYVEFESAVDGHPVLGIGDVELEVKAGILKEQNAYGRLILHNVLFIPKWPCNIIGSNIVDDYDLENAHQKKEFCLKDPETAEIRGRFVANRLGLFKLLIRRQSRESPNPRLRAHHDLKVKWPATERNRWEVLKSTILEPEPFSPVSRNGAPRRRSESSPPSSRHKNSFSASANSSLADSQPYSAPEKVWLKSHWGGEYYLLRAFGLSIESEDDRAEGRHIVRGMMAQQNSTDEEQDWF